MAEGDDEQHLLWTLAKLLGGNVMLDTLKAWRPTSNLVLPRLCQLWHVMQCSVTAASLPSASASNVNMTAFCNGPLNRDAISLFLVPSPFGISEKDQVPNTVPLAANALARNPSLATLCILDPGLSL